MKRTVIIIMLITILSKLFGFARDITLSYFYGASNISDAYLISLTIPTVLFSIIGVGIKTGYIPMFNKIESTSGTEAGNRFTNNLINILFIICTLIIILGLVFTEQIVKVFALGFEGDTLALAIQFTKISLVGIYFTGFVFIFKAFLEVKGNFFIPALIGLPLNIIIIFAIFLSPTTNIIILSIGTVIALASQWILLIPSSYRLGYKYKLVLDIKDKHIRNMAIIALPIIIGVSVNQINILVDRTIASQITVGGISALSYADRINAFVQGIFVLSITTVMYPIISKMAVKKNIEGIKKTVNESIAGINLLVVPATVITMVFAEQIVGLLFGRGAFNHEAILLTSNALFFYSIGMIGIALREVISRVFYSFQDTRTPMVNAAVAVILNIILSLTLSKYLGIGGLALATSISAVFCTILLFISLRKRIGDFGIKNIVVTFSKILSASLVMGGVLILFYQAMNSVFIDILAIFISIGCCVLVYLIIIYFMNIEDVRNILYAFRRKFKK
ncbi:murein biosynthesis integral membrane protein MurJ [Halalkalibacter nanhaiisediminis]|uniref:Probable lipid II flippase MurJ n=1 Tax=Halalkalibacter nanhaiisediminis TaxID=688079 RepID=A0A562QSY2_9BACI|nr:murein biosynthesis integral membrane protein MurJ [Halalkalibacter nanhaiisediminis]TWI59881.1 putative peptidoglycan lipid II flippase [Halalkalibacter nanhaiisediminis]